MEIKKTKKGNNEYNWLKFQHEGESILGTIIKININDDDSKRSHVIIADAKYEAGEGLPSPPKALFLNILPWMVESFELKENNQYRVECTEVRGNLVKISFTLVPPVHEDWIVHDSAENYSPHEHERDMSGVEKLVDYFTQRYEGAQADMEMYKSLLKLLEEIQ